MTSEGVKEGCDRGFGFYHERRTRREGKKEISVLVMSMIGISKHVLAIGHA